MSSPPPSSTSTPLYRVFRGLKSTQVVATPANDREWRVTLNDFKNIYLEGRWKECESKCTRLLEASKNKPTIYPYLLFLIGSCVEIHARNMHQYSAGKGKKMEEAADWFEKCEMALPPQMKLPEEHNTVNKAVRTPQMSPEEQILQVADIDISPLTAFGAKVHDSGFLMKCPERRDNQEQWNLHDKASPGTLVSSITRSRMIDLTLDSPFNDETDPFISLTPESSSTKPRIDGNWSIPPLPRLAPSPLRIRKKKSDSILRRSSDELPQFTTIPSPLSQASTANEFTFSPEDELPESPLRSLEVRPLRMRDDLTFDNFEFVERYIDSTQYHNSGYLSDYDDSQSVFGRDIDDFGDFPTSPTFSVKYDSFDGDWDERGEPDKEHHQYDSFYGDWDERIEPYKEQSSFLTDEEFAHYLCAKPSPLRIKPKKAAVFKPCKNFDSDKVSLARLQRFWEVSSFNGIYAIDSDAHSLHVVEPTWAHLSAKYHAALVAENERIQALRTHIANYNNHLASLSDYLQQNVLRLRQLAIDIDLNRTSHIESRRIQPTKSYWSFAVKGNGGGPDSGNDDGSDDYDEHRDRPEMKANLSWAAPGTILNETKKERIKRLKSERFETVGMQNEKRGHKGRAWYLDLCEEVLEDIQGLMRGAY